MQFSYPHRKSSHPTPFTPRSRSAFPKNIFRRSRLKTCAVIGLLLFVVFFAVSRLFSSTHTERIPYGTPPVVIVTVLDESGYSGQYMENVKQNRMEYAKRHGYVTFLPKVDDYELNGSPKSWAAIPAMRHALTKFPHSTYFFYLSQNSLIMNPSLTIEKHIMDSPRIESLMLKNRPIVPPDSVIKTCDYLKGSDVHLAITQGPAGLDPGSFLLRRGEWSKFFLDTWFDPLYRTYNFQKAETHALEHIVQWHPTILLKMAIVPQRIINAYIKSDKTNEESAYKDGDFIVRFPDCAAQDRKNCETISTPFSQEWQTIFHASRR